MSLVMSSVDRLPLWDQIAIRTYTPICLCFPHDDEALQEETAKHLESALERLAAQVPLLATTLRLGTGSESAGFVFLGANRSSKIPIEVVALPVPLRYADLKDRDFPACAFIVPDLTINGTFSPDHEPLATVRIRMSFVQGGLLLFMYFHHSVIDGDCMHMFIEAFAAQTRHSSSFVPTSPHLALCSSSSSSSSSRDKKYLSKLLSLFSWKKKQGEEVVVAQELPIGSQTPEYSFLPTPTGPIAPTLIPGGVPASCIHKAGKLFVFRKSRLEALRMQIVSKQLEHERPASIYTSLAALTWAHVAKARLDTECFLDEDEHDRDAKPGRLFLPVTWRGRCFREETSNYLGNTVATVFAEASVAELDAAVELDDFSTLAAIVGRLGEAIRSVDETMVRTRQAVFEKLEDPRRLGMNLDPRRPQDLVFNTWRHLGADSEWDIPGSGASVKPDAIRRIQDEWKVAGVTIMPGRSDSAVYEIVVNLPACSMDALCTDPVWMGYVDRILD